MKELCEGKWNLFYSDGRGVRGFKQFYPKTECCFTPMEEGGRMRAVLPQKRNALMRKRPLTTARLPSSYFCEITVTLKSFDLKVISERLSVLNLLHFFDRHQKLTKK